LSAVGALTTASVAIAFLPLTVVAATVGVVLAFTSEKGKILLGRAGTQTKDLCLDLVHYASKDLAKARDGLDGVFSKNEKPTEQKPAERPAANLPKPSAPAFNATAPRPDPQPIPLAESRSPEVNPVGQKIDVTG
jgi:hypothetical protein